jgi:hypothetical protein
VAREGKREMYVMVSTCVVNGQNYSSRVNERPVGGSRSQKSRLISFLIHSVFKG